MASVLDSLSGYVAGPNPEIPFPRVLNEGECIVVILATEDGGQGGSTAPIGWTSFGSVANDNRVLQAWGKIAVGGEGNVTLTNTSTFYWTYQSIILDTGKVLPDAVSGVGVTASLIDGYDDFPAAVADYEIVIPIILGYYTGQRAPLTVINSRHLQFTGSVFLASFDSNGPVTAGTKLGIDTSTSGAGVRWIQLSFPKPPVLDLVALSTSESVQDGLIYPQVEVVMSPDAVLERKTYAINDLFDDPLYVAKPYVLNKDLQGNRYSLETLAAALERYRPKAPIIMTPSTGTSPEGALNDVLTVRKAEFPQLKYEVIPELRVRGSLGLIAPDTTLIHVVPGNSDESLRDEILEFVAPFSDYATRTNSKGRLEVVPAYWMDYGLTPAVTLTDDDIAGDYIESVGLRAMWNQATVTNRPWGYSETFDDILDPAVIRMRWTGINWGAAGVLPTDRKKLLDAVVSATNGTVTVNWPVTDKTKLLPGTDSLVLVINASAWDRSLPGSGTVSGPYDTFYYDTPVTAAGGISGTGLTLHTYGSLSLFPGTGTAGQLYKATDTGLYYSWIGGEYQQVNADDKSVVTVFPLDGAQHFICSAVLNIVPLPSPLNYRWVNISGRWDATYNAVVLTLTETLHSLAGDLSALFLIEMNGQGKSWGQLDTEYSGRFGFTTGDYSLAPGLQEAQIADGISSAPTLAIEKYSFGNGLFADQVCTEIATSRVLAHYRPRSQVKFNLAPGAAGYPLGPDHLNKLIELSDGRLGVLTAISHSENYSPYITAVRSCTVEILPEEAAGQLLDTNGNPVLDTNGQPIYTTKVV